MIIFYQMIETQRLPSYFVPQLFVH